MGLLVIVPLCICLSCHQPPVQATTSFLARYSHHGANFDTHTTTNIIQFRGGSTTESTGKKKKKRSNSHKPVDPFEAVARAIQDRMISEFADDDKPTDISIADMVDAMQFLSSSQQTFKGLDGAAHEAYQLTHASNNDDVDLSVRGRARRSAARASATADGLGACELCELLELSSSSSVNEEDDLWSTMSINGTLVGRQVVLNLTADESSIQLDDGSKISVIVLYETIYNGGAGILHGGIVDEDDTPMSRGKKMPSQGRLIIIIGDELRNDLTNSLKLLDSPPKHVRLSSGLVSGEIASVQPRLYKAGASLLLALEPTLRDYENKTAAIHFVGRSLAGGIANLAAVMLDGGLPMPNKNNNNKKASKKKNKATKEKHAVPEDDDLTVSESASLNTTDGSSNNITTVRPLSGLGKDRTSAVSLGAPPCLSSNVPSDFIISIMYGDDVLCRATRASFDRLLKRSKKALKSKGWIGGRQLNFMSDALALTTSSLKSHAHGSEGEELRLSLPGRAYLLRPRRLGGSCSIHEVGDKLKGGREALRAHLLWQLDDILLSKSLWKHHQLDSYIHGLDRAHLRGVTDDGGEDEG